MRRTGAKAAHAPATSARTAAIEWRTVTQRRPRGRGGGETRGANRGPASDPRRYGRIFVAFPWKQSPPTFSVTSVVAVVSLASPSAHAPRVFSVTLKAPGSREFGLTTTCVMPVEPDGAVNLKPVPFGRIDVPGI